MGFEFDYHGYQITVVRDSGIVEITVLEWNEDMRISVVKADFFLRDYEEIDEGEALQLVMHHIDSARNSEGRYIGGSFTIVCQYGCKCIIG